jgi:GntR family transcriptional regulator of arabinose operon
LERSKPKYQQLKEYLMGMIKDKNLVPGSKIPSENELAKKFNISRHTVRKAISELSNEGWLTTSQGKGTFVRNSLKKTHHSRIIGVVTTYLNDYIFPSIIRGIDQVLSQNGYNIVLGCTDNQFDKEKVCLTNLLNQNIDGLIVETTKSALPNPNIELYMEFEKRGIPVLFIHGRYKDYKASSVYEDDVQAGYLAAKHLIELGHRKIGGIFKIDDIQGHERFRGFIRAIQESGVDLADSRIIWFDTNDIHIKFVKNPSGLLNGFLSDCTGIVCYNDQISLKIIDVVREKGIAVPKQLSIVSFDDSDLAVVSGVKLTTVAHPKEKLGMKAAELIIKMLEEPGRVYQVKIKPELIVRSSSDFVSPISADGT